MIFKENTMSRTLIALGLLTMAGAASLTAALATEPIDPHQRARETIVPPPVAHAPAPQGVMGRLIEAGDYEDPHARARNVIRDERWPLASAHPGAVGASASTGYADPQRHIRSVIQGHDD